MKDSNKPPSPAPERKGTFELLTDIVASWEKDMRALLAAKDAEIAALKSRAERLREALRRIRRRGGNYAGMKEIAHAALAEEREEK